jgi:iron-sulfur cluster repair protein YtfE (RIC family)
MRHNWSTMLVQVGKRDQSEDVVDLLLACHERIRRFLTMARTLATAHASEPCEVQLAAAQIRRYFAEALPLHVADEQEEILPRLASAAPAIDQALTAMLDEHCVHEPMVARLVALCGEVEREPSQLAVVGADLAALIAELTTELERHLAQEEQVIFPAIRRLAAAERDAILVAMRRRRERVLGSA